LRAGFSFNQAMSIAVRDMFPPISDEFARVLRENSLGKSLDDSLRNLIERNEDEDLNMVVTALLIQRQVGGNLSEILDTISNTIRERVRIKGEVKTLTAQGRISALVIGFLPTGLALILTIINPEYILTLFQYSLGIMMVVAGVIMQLIGIYAIFKLVDIKV
jgi:tight adherence protein B